MPVLPASVSPVPILPHRHFCFQKQFITRCLVMVTFLEVAHEFDALLIVPQRIFALRYDTALGICDHEADRIGFGCVLKQIRFQPEMVFPETLPLMINTFLFRAVFGVLGRLFMVRPSVRGRMILFKIRGTPVFVWPAPRRVLVGRAV